MTFNRLIIAASPRAKGRSALLSQALCAALERAYPFDTVTLVSLCELHISFCRGCDTCKCSVWRCAIDELLNASKKNAVSEKNGLPSRIICENSSARCALFDDMQQVYEALDICNELFVVSPVYFAGVPANFKALLDRLQPYFWTNIRQAVKRPAYLYVVGEGGDPHGFVPLVGTVRSALSVAGFHLKEVHDWVGHVIEDKAFLASADLLRDGRIHAASAYIGKDPYGTYPRSLRNLHEGFPRKIFDE